MNGGKGGYWLNGQVKTKRRRAQGRTAQRVLHDCELMEHNPAHEPGTYWFRRDPSPRDIMVHVRVMDGELTDLWPNIDQPVAKLKEAQWRGPIPPSKGPGSR